MLIESKDIDILIAPHHGRKSGGNDEYLDYLNPKLTLFWNAPSKDMAYAKFYCGEYRYITQNQAGTIVLVETVKGIKVYCSNKNFSLAFCKKHNKKLLHRINSSQRVFAIRNMRQDEKIGNCFIP